VVSKQPPGVCKHTNRKRLRISHPPAHPTNMSLSLHHWATLVRQHNDTNYYIVYCNHRNKSFPDYLAFERTKGDDSARVVSVITAYGRDVISNFHGMDNITDEMHISDAKRLVTEMDNYVRSGKGFPSGVYGKYLRDRYQKNMPGVGSHPMGQYGHGMSPGNGVMGHHDTMGDYGSVDTGAMGQYGHGMTPGNGVMGHHDTMGNYGVVNTRSMGAYGNMHSGRIANHYGHGTFSDMGTGM